MGSNSRKLRTVKTVRKSIFFRGDYRERPCLSVGPYVPFQFLTKNLFLGSTNQQRFCGTLWCLSVFVSACQYPVVLVISDCSPVLFISLVVAFLPLISKDHFARGEGNWIA